MKRVGMTALLLAFLLALPACDKKISDASVRIAEDATAQSLALSKKWSAVPEWVATKADEQEDAEGLFDNVDATLKDCAFGTQEGLDALKVKRKMADNAVKQVGNTARTLESMTTLVRLFNKGIRAKNEADAAAMTAWQTEALKQLKLLAVTFRRLDDSIQADLAKE